MELYFSPLACSLATRIALYESDQPARFTRVDLSTKKTEDGGDYLAINPLGQVPVLETDEGDVLYENGAILQYVAERQPDAELVPRDGRARTRLQQWLSFLGSEIHKVVFAPLVDATSNDGARDYARSKIPSRFSRLAQHLGDREFLLDGFTVADAYLTTMLNWTALTGPDLGDWPALKAYHQRQLARPGLGRAVSEERALYFAEAKRS
jgi:glutathione S-transferase